MEFSDGVKSMARNTLPAIDLVREGRWTLDDVEKWLRAVIADDESFLETMRRAGKGEQSLESGRNETL